MTGIVAFPALTRAQQAVADAQRERAEWIQEQMRLGRTKAAIGRDLGISRQLVDEWLKMPKADHNPSAATGHGEEKAR